MVTETPATEVAEAPPGDEVAEAVEAEDAPSPDGAEETEATEETPEPDPLAELKTAVDALRQSAATKTDLNELRSATGRIDGLQSTLSKLAEQNPLASVDPRIAGIERTLIAMLDGQIADPATDDARRASLVQERQQLDAAGRQRDIDSAVTEAVGKALPEQTEPESTVPADPAVDAMKVELVRYAKRAGVDYASIAPEVLSFLPTDTNIPQVTERVMDHIDTLKADLAEEAGATERVTSRAAAAGGGTPARSGGASTIDDLRTRLEENGPAALTEADRKRVADELGVSLQT